MGRRKDAASLLALLDGVEVTADLDLGGAVLTCRLSPWCVWYQSATTVQAAVRSVAGHVRECHARPLRG